MLWFWGCLALLVLCVLYWMWKEDEVACDHQWEPIGMIDWQCRACGTIVDGPPPEERIRRHGDH